MLCDSPHPDQPERKCQADAQPEHRWHYSGMGLDRIRWENPYFDTTPKKVEPPARATKGVSSKVRQTILDMAGRAKGDHRSVDDNVVLVGADHPETSKDAAVGLLPRSGTIRRSVYDYLLSLGDRGATDKEGEAAFGEDHESYSGCRRGLVIDGWVMDSGAKRLTPKGNEAIVWVAVPESAQRSA